MGVLPVYIIFEIAWLITGTVWLIGIDSGSECDKTIHVFSMVVVINFWIHILTPLLFMLCLCCTKIFPFLGHCTYWNLMKGAIDMWTRPVRITIVSVIAVPLGLSMIAMGGHSLQDCESLVNHTDTDAMVLQGHLTKEIHTENPGILSLEMVHIPIWLCLLSTLSMMPFANQRMSILVARSAAKCWSSSFSSPASLGLSLGSFGYLGPTTRRTRPAVATVQHTGLPLPASSSSTV